MFKEPPESVSQDTVTFKVSELEPFLCGPNSTVPEFDPAYVKLKNGQEMVIRQVRKEEAKKLLGFIKQMLDVDHDFYDIVGVRVYAEILGWLRNRLKDPYTLVGLIDGELAAFANGRIMNEDINISLHTMAFKRGLRAGAVMFYAKCDYVFNKLNQEEFWATFESYNGLKRWGIGMALPSYPWPDYQHELGGAKVYYLSREYWDSTVHDYIKQMAGTELVRPVPDELLKKNENIIIPKLEV